MTTTAPKPVYVSQQWNFKVSIQGLAIGYFTKVSEISQEFELTPHHVGGEPDPIFFQPAKRTTTPVTLSKGSSDNDELWVWWGQHADVEGAGLDVSELQREVRVDEYSRDKKRIVKTWILGKCIMKRFKAGEFDGGSSEDVIQEAVIQPVSLDKI
jgi:phage tail-like protein